MKKALIKLLQYIATNNIPVVKSKAGNGICCYKLGQIESHRDAIKTLASACNWNLQYFKPKYNPKTEEMSSPLYYIGPKVSNELSKDDILGIVHSYYGPADE